MLTFQHVLEKPSHVHTLKKSMLTATYVTVHMVVGVVTLKYIISKTIVINILQPAHAAVSCYNGLSLLTGTIQLFYRVLSYANINWIILPVEPWI